jgi:homopolymeric O-antigen transport system permease protein
MKQLVADFKEMFAEEAQYRELLMALTRRDLLIRYKQTVMGFGWAIFMPLMNTAVFSVIFTKVAPLDTAVPYPLFAYCGFLVWNFSAASFRTAVASLTGNAGLVTKVYFPREVLPISTILVALVDFAVGSTVLAALMAWYRIAPTAAILYLPLVVLVQIAFTAAVALFVAMSNLFYRDVKYLFEVVIMVWMFATSVAYPVQNVEGWVGVVLRLNPMTVIIDAYRAVLFGSSGLDLTRLAATGLFSIVALAGVWLVFHRSEAEFAERV